MKLAQENNLIKDTEDHPVAASEIRLALNPWWVYFLYAGSDVLGRVLAARAATDGQNEKPARGAKVSLTGGLEPGVDPERITATAIIGERILGSDGKELGKVEEVAMNLTTGEVSYLVLAAGGVMGFGGKFYALPLESLTFNPEDKTFTIDLNKKQLKLIPEFDKHNWPKKATWPVKAVNSNRPGSANPNDQQTV